MRRVVSTGWLSWLALGGCAGTAAVGVDEPAPPSGADVDTGGPSLACDAHVMSFEPGSTTLSPQTRSLTVRFDAAVPRSSWDLRLVLLGFADGSPSDPDAVPRELDGEATLADDRLSATWVSRDPLPADARLRLTARACDDAASVEIVTTPSPIDPAALAGRSWSIAAPDLQIVSPAASPLLVSVLPELRIRLTAVLDEGEVSLDAAMSTRGECLDDIDFGPLDLHGNPSFRAGPVDFGTDDDDPRYPPVVSLSSALLSGTFVHDGADIRDLALTALYDTRSAPPLPSPVELCTISADLGEPCVPCPDGAPRCLPVLIVQPVVHSVTSPRDDAGCGPG
jgi:hypothetical protein